MTVGGQDLAARDVYVHPAHNLAVVKFNTSSIDTRSFRACRFNPPETSLQPGDTVYYVPINVTKKKVTKTTVMSVHES